MEETEGWRQLSLSAVGMAGVVLLLGGAGNGTLTAQTLVGYGCAFGSALCMAFYTVAAGRSGTSMTRVLFPASVAGTGIALIGTAISGTPWPPVQDWTGSIYLGVGPMAAGYLLWATASAHGDPTTIGAIGYLTPFASTTLLIAQGAPITALTVVGAVLILLCNVGVLVLDRRTGDRRARDEGTTAVGRKCVQGA
ncbi:DMT family transporter [Nonomuraea sp. NPDC050404]|uniref:DMT family transporter n=1 Tax=Nonomuraea sp. NPDC050404 TaxID=3155783 RepID=UPI0033D57BDB